MEGASFSGNAFGGDKTMMPFYDLFARRQPYALARVLIFIQLLEQQEHILAFFRVKANTVISKVQAHINIFCGFGIAGFPAHNYPGGYCNRWCVILCLEFDTIIYQVLKKQHNTKVISLYHRQRLRNMYQFFYMLLFRKCMYHTFQQLVKIYFAYGDLLRAYLVIILQVGSKQAH